MPLQNPGITDEKVPRFSGDIYYVATDGDDANDGRNPDAAKLTIGGAIAVASAGDAITVKTGTYIENINMNLAGLELWGEIGAIVVGTITISANSCRVRGMIASPVAAVGVALTGSYCKIEDTHIVGTPTASFDIDGAYNIIYDCKTAGYAVTGFDISNTRVHLYRCAAHGADTATRGFYLSNAAATTCYLEGCSSIGNATSGYHLVTGVMNVELKDCSSGAGDGRWIDADTASVWSNFTFEDNVYTTLTFDGSGPTSANLYLITGSVIFTELSGEVETVLAGDIGNAYLELFDGANTVDVTDSPGPSFNSLPVATFIHKIDDNTAQIAIEDSSQVRLYEDATKFGEDPNFQVTARDGVATYLRLTYSGNGASGAIHWHAKWEPLTEDGFVSPA